MAKIDLKQVLKNHRGQPQKHEGDDATLGIIAYAALINIAPQEAGIGRDERLKRGKLAQKLVPDLGGTASLTSDEIVLIKQCIAMSFGPWVVAVTEDMLEGPELKVVEK